jgi:hypothetical protein
VVDGVGVVASAALSDILGAKPAAVLSFSGVSASLNDRKKIPQSYFTYSLESRGAKVGC